MDDPTDLALGISAGVGIAICGLCVLVAAWRESNKRFGLKPSRSNTELTQLTDGSGSGLV